MDAGSMFRWTRSACAVRPILRDRLFGQGGFVGQVRGPCFYCGREQGQSCERQSGCDGGVCAHSDVEGAETPEQFLA